MEDYEEISIDIHTLECKLAQLESNLTERYEDLIMKLFEHTHTKKFDDLMFDYDIAFTDKHCNQHFDYPQSISLDKNNEICINSVNHYKTYFYDLSVNEKKLIVDDIIKYLNNDNDE